MYFNTVYLVLLIFVISSCSGRVSTQMVESEDVIDSLSIVNDIETFEEQSTNQNLLFDIKKIDSITYFALKKNVNIQKEELEKITDLKQAKKMLKGQVIWGKKDPEWEGDHEEGVYKIMFRNGKTLLYDYGLSFNAYFPQEDILYLVGVHQSDMIFNLTTGEETENVGNPEYRYYSPSKKYRLNMFDNGQTSLYYVQEKMGTQYRTIIDSWELQKKIGFFIEDIFDAFWQSNTVLYFETINYNAENGEKLYYQLILK